MASIIPPRTFPTAPVNPNENPEHPSVVTSSISMEPLQKYPYSMSAEVIDESNFEEVSDARFQELLGSENGISVNQFFKLYDKLKYVIQPGVITLKMIGEFRYGDIIDGLKEAAQIENPNSIFLNKLSILTNSVRLTDALTLEPGGENTHAFLVSSSLPLTDGTANDQLRLVFSTIGMLFRESASLSNQLNDTNHVVDLLRDDNASLTIALNNARGKLPIGFQLTPDLIQISPNGESKTITGFLSGNPPFGIQVGNQNIIREVRPVTDQNNNMITEMVIIPGGTIGKTFIKFTDSSDPIASEVIYVDSLAGVSGEGGGGISGVGIIAPYSPGPLTFTYENPEIPFYMISPGKSKKIVIFGLHEYDDTLEIIYPNSLVGQLTDSIQIQTPRATGGSSSWAEVTLTFTGNHAYRSGNVIIRTVPIARFNRDPNSRDYFKREVSVAVFLWAF